MEFTTSDVLSLFEINRNTFQDWLDRDLIRPSINKSTKQGEANIFSKRDLYAIYCFKHLKELGIERKVARTISMLFLSVTQKKGVEFDFLIVAKNKVSGQWSNFVSLEKVDWDRYLAGVVISCKDLRDTVDSIVGKSDI